MVTQPRKTTKIDMHIHTRGSDGTGSPEAIAHYAVEAGLDAICITDHHRTYTAESLEVARACRAHGVMVFHGCEYSTDAGHLLLYGVDVEHFMFGYYPDMQEVINAVNVAGGRAVPAHPYKGYRRLLGDRVKDLTGVAGVEIANGQCATGHTQANVLAKAAAESMKVPGFGGSDAHRPENIGITYTRFNRVITSYLDLIEAIDDGDFTAMISRKRVWDIQQAERKARKSRKPKASDYRQEDLLLPGEFGWAMGPSDYDIEVEEGKIQ